MVDSSFDYGPLTIDLYSYLYKKMQAVLSLFQFIGREESPGNIEHLAS